jgi:uncharacterized protein (DUF1501 family)
VIVVSAVAETLAADREKWRGGFTRRRVVAGMGAVGVAALGSQLVTTRVAFAAPAAATTRTLVVVFLRGGMDGLSLVVPAFDADLYKARPTIAVPQSKLLAGHRGFGLHPSLAPLYPYWKSGQLAAVHAVGFPDVSRSHFQAQDCVERGATSTGVRTGWLDRMLTALGPGSTFRAVANSGAQPRSLLGAESKVVIDGLSDFALAGTSDDTMAALQTLFTGVDNPYAAQSLLTLGAMTAARALPASTSTTYPAGEFATALADVARLIKSGAGVRVATIDVGGWDMHTGLGKVDGGDMKTHLDDLSAALAAFGADLGTKLDDVNLVAMSEFGRRVAENGNAGADHGHGGLMLLLGGGLMGGRVHGTWPGLAPANLDRGDLAVANDYRDVLGELLATRFGVTNTSAIFPAHTYKRLGVAR